MNKTIVTLADARDAHNFTRGDTFLWDPTVGWRRQTRWDRFKDRVRDLLKLGERLQVVEVDRECVCVTLERVRWSWLRWKWVRS